MGMAGLPKLNPRFLGGLTFAQYHSELPVSFLTYLSTLLRPKARKSSKMAGSPHLLMRGIKDSIFLTQWGTPGIKISLRDFKAFFIVDFLSANIETPENVTAWVYEKKDRVFFFEEEKLISHFKWSLFKIRFRRPQQQDLSSHGTSRKIVTLHGNEPPHNLEGELAFG